MSGPDSPAPLTPEQRRIVLRNRAAMVAVAALGLLGTIGFTTYTQGLMASYEERLIAGDFPHMHVETVPVRINEGGKVESQGEPFYYTRMVGSLKLTPPGAYSAILVAHDGNEKHREKAELVLAAKDAEGRWHPESATQLLERLKVPSPNTPR